MEAGQARAGEVTPGASGDEDGSFTAEESSSYFQFFRGLHEEYLSLAGRRRRAWRRACLQLLHAELDDADAEAERDAEAQQCDFKPVIVEHALSVMPQ